MSPERERRRLLLAIHLLECPECGPAGAASVLRANPEAETPEELDPRRPEAARSAAQALAARSRRWEPGRLEERLGRWAESGIRFLTPESSGFPRNLLESPYRPALLSLRGTLAPEDDRALTVVGTRRATDYGFAAVEKIVAEIAPHRPTIVSGMAEGIDRCAHRAALANGLRTLAVLGEGLAVPQNRRTRELREEIESRGAVLSPFLPDASARAWTFPFRNRILSGLSRGTLVAQSRVKGGAMITARLAADEGRDVFAVPGSIFAESSGGCNLLVAEGATPVCEGATVAEALRWRAPRPGSAASAPAARQTSLFASPAPDALLSGLSPEERALWEVCPSEPGAMDEALRRAGMPDARALAILAMLEMQGLVRRLPGNRIVRASR